MDGRGRGAFARTGIEPPPPYAEPMAEEFLLRAIEATLANEPHLKAWLQARPAVTLLLADSIRRQLAPDRGYVVATGSGRWAVMALHKAALKKAPSELRDEARQHFARWIEHDEALAAALSQTLGAMLAADPASGLALHLAAEPNPDFAPGSPEATVRIQSTWRRIASLRAARLAVRAFVSGNDLGSGNFTGGEVFHNGRRWARIAYNGRAFRDHGRGEVQRELQIDSTPGHEVYVAG